MISSYLDTIGKLDAEYSYAKRRAEEEGAALASTQDHIKNLTEAQSLVQEVAEQVQQIAHHQIAAVVTRCLGVIFGNDAYGLKIRFERKRSKTDAVIILYKNDLELEDPLNETGGGVIDVASLGFRLACLLLTKPHGRRLLVMDEPFRFLNGEEFQKNVVDLISMLAEEMEVQLIVCTDDDWLKIGKVIDLNSDGEAECITRN